MMTCGEYLVKLLESYGVELIFGIPGVHTVELYRGLPATRIRHVTPRHEQGAGFMADGYARVSGKPGVCFIVTGPGMTNIATAMGQAFADSVPMLVISAVNGRAELGMNQGRLHELPSQRGLVSGVSAFSHTLLDPRQLPEMIARAFSVFRAARPRPVHIEIPLDVMTARADGLSLTPWPIPERPAPATGAIREAARLIAMARMPLIVAGGGAADAAGPITTIAERLDAPVFMTVNGRGVLPLAHPLALAGNLAMAPLREALAAADLVLAIGTEFGETEMYPSPMPLAFGGPLIRIDIDPAQLVTSLPAALPIVADARLAATALLSVLSPGQRTANGAGRAQAVRDAVLADLWPGCMIHRALLGVISDALPDAIIAGDQTEPVYTVNQVHQASRPRSFFNSSTGYGTLGYGLPAAFGARLAAPHRPSVCLIGDGGLQFSAPELAAAVEARIACAVVVWNNHSYGEIKTYMEERGIPRIGVDLFTPDIVKLAEAFGCIGVRPDTIAQLRGALVASTSQRRPIVIEIQAGGPLAHALGL